MKLIVPALVCVTAFALTSTTSSAQTTKQQTTASKATTAAAPKKVAASAKPTTVRAMGKLSAVDEAGKMVTLTTSKGSQQFTLGSATHIEEGSKAIDMAALAKLVGHDASVSYLESGGMKTVQSVRVSASAPKSASAKTTSSKTTGKKS